MFSVLHKKENGKMWNFENFGYLEQPSFSAHNEPIWTSCWPRHEAEQFDYIVTGSLDNDAKIWRW